MKKIKYLSHEEKDNINDETLELLEPYEAGRNTWFSEEKAKSAGKAIGSLWNWCWAMIKYTEKAKIVKPR